MLHLEHDEGTNPIGDPEACVGMYYTLNMVKELTLEGTLRLVLGCTKLNLIGDQGACVGIEEHV